MHSIRSFVLAIALSAAAHAAEPPVIIAVEPPRIPPAGGVRVIIAGEHFTPGAVVRLCGERVADATWVTRNQIDFVAPAHPAGACDVAVENADGQEARMPALFAYSEPALEPPALGPALAPTPGRVLGAPLPPAAVAAPRATVLRPPAPPPPERTAAEFMTRLIGKDDTAPLAHARMRSPPPSGVLFGWQVSDAFPGTFAGLAIVHYEGRLESINTQGLRAWFPFVLHVTRDPPSQVTGFATSPDPGATRGALVAAIEAEQGTGIQIDLDQPLRPLP